MIVKIDLEVLKKEDLTPDDYVFLWGLFYKINLDIIEIYPNFIPLEEKGFIKIGDDDYILSNQGRSLFEPQGIEAKFLEFWTSYPIRTPTGRGLRDSSSDTKQAGVCKAKYEKVLKKNPNIHKSVMKGLTEYLKVSDKRFLVAIEVFINQEMWNKYINETELKEDLGTTQSI